MSSAGDAQDEAETIARAKAGDEAALVELLARHLPDVHAAAERALPSRHAAILSADDVIQQTCVDVFRDLARFVGRTENTFAAWLHTLARRNMLDAVRMLDAEKRRGRRVRMPPATREQSYIALIERLPGSTSSPSRAAARREACAALDSALDALPKDYREIVQRFDLNGEPIEAIAADLGRSRGAAYMIRSRAHRMLAELMGGASLFFSTGGSG